MNTLPAGDTAYRDWFTSRGGVLTFQYALQIVLRGASAKTVVISDLRLVKDCQPMLKGTLFYSPPAGQNENIFIGFDLDERVPVARTYDKNGPTGGNYFKEHTISLKPDETQTLVVLASTTKQYCKFHFELVVTTGDEPAPPSIPLTNEHGDDFAVTAMSLNESYDPEYAEYAAVYLGGVMSPRGDDSFVEVDPKTLR